MSGAGAAAAAFAGLLALGISGPSTASGSASGATGGTVTSTPQTVLTVVNPFGSFTVAWTNRTGGGITATAATNASTFFSKAMAADESVTDTMRCTVTDSIGRTAFWEVTVTLTHSSGA